MFDSTSNPYEAPKAVLSNTRNDNKLSKLLNILFYVITDLTLCYFLTIDIWYGFKAVPTFRKLYYKAGFELSWPIRIGLHPFISKIIPFIILGAALILHYRKIRIQKYSKIGLIIVALISVGIYYLMIFSTFHPLSN